jgi:hypothetical protein
MSKDIIKCRIFRGTKFEDESGEIKFLFNEKIDKGYDHFVNSQEFELEVKKWNLLLGYFTDAYDEKGNIFWSNYQDVEEKPDLPKLRLEYKELSGEEAKKNWGAKKLTEEIDKLKEK